MKTIEIHIAKPFINDERKQATHASKSVSEFRSLILINKTENHKNKITIQLFKLMNFEIDS